MKIEEAGSLAPNDREQGGVDGVSSGLGLIKQKKQQNNNRNNNNRS